MFNKHRYTPPRPRVRAKETRPRRASIITKRLERTREERKAANLHRLKADSSKEQAERITKFLVEKLSAKTMVVACGPSSFYYLLIDGVPFLLWVDSPARKRREEVFKNA